MNVGRIMGGNAAFRAVAQPVQKSASQKTAAELPTVSRRRDRLDIRYEDVLKAEKEGFVEVDGRRYAVSGDEAAGMRSVYEQLKGRNEGIASRLDAAQNARLEKQRDETAKTKGVSMGRAMQIARRISEGGSVPAQDEQYLMAFSREMYLSARMMASTAERQKEFDSVFGDDELLGMAAEKIAGEVEKELENEPRPTEPEQ